MKQVPRMKKMIKASLLLSVTVLIWATWSYAAFVPVPDGKPNWQQLDAQDESGLGVLWKVSSDGGTTWGDVGRETNLYVGQTIQFQYNMYKPISGGHAYDFLKAWAHMADPVTGAIISNFETAGKDYLFFNQEPVTKDGLFTYTDTNEYTLTTAGDLFVRARVTCSSALLSSKYGIGELNFRSDNHSTARVTDDITWKQFQQNWDPDYRRYQKVWRNTYEEMFTSSILLPNQGETEDYRISVSAIPEPATMVLFGFGLIWLAKICRRET